MNRFFAFVVLASASACMPRGEFPTCTDVGDDIEFAAVPTWSDDVAPLMAEHCSSCHQEGGSAPFALATFEDAAPFSAAIGSAVVSRRMPPAGPSSCGECQTFSNAPWLTPEEIATIRAWSDGGAPAGEPETSPLEPRPTAGLSRVDRSLSMGRPYQPGGDERATDDYRCFVVDPELDTTQYLTGFEVQPGNEAVVHHVILYGLYSAYDQGLAAELEQADDGYGFPCFGTSGIDNAPMLAAWAPGTPPIVYPSGSGVRLTPSMKLIMQVHYHLEGDAEPDQSSMDLMLQDSVPDEAVLFPAGNWEFYLPPGESSVTDSQVFLDFIGPVGPVQVHGVAPHLHTRGQSMQVEIGVGADHQCLLDVPKWDFNWQGLYFYEEPLTVKSGAMARVTCTWDTTDASGTTEWGDGTEDEMCLALFYITGLPQNRLDAWYASSE